MIPKLAKNVAHFFVVKNVASKSKEAIYAYGMELLISDVLNTLIVLLIALISHTLPAVIIFIAVFMILRRFVGGYHANNHLSCMFTLIMVMLAFSYGICNVRIQLMWILSICFITIALPVIFCIAPVPHPNKPMITSTWNRSSSYYQSKSCQCSSSFPCDTHQLFHYNSLLSYNSCRSGSFG